MPELPEVETIRRDLETHVTGERIEHVHVGRARSVRRHGAIDDFVARLRGRTIAAVRRRGKYLFVGLEGGAALVVHLGMSGQLKAARSPQEPLDSHTHVVLTFTRGSQLRYVDPRTFGQLFVTETEGADRVPDLAHLGLDPLVDAVSSSRLGELLRARRSRLKPLLMDQRFLAGIGNLYADEILWAARLRWDRRADTLSSPEVRRLARSLVGTLEEAVEHRGSSLADAQYRDLFGRTGRYQAHHKAYDREGQPCPRCRTPIVRLRTHGRSTFMCGRCQV